MKRTLSSLLAAVMLIGGLLAFSGCKKKDLTYKVSTEEFYFSTDNGSTYGNRRVEFPVGDSVYMQVVVLIESSDEEEHVIEGELSIPNIQSVDAYYLKGQKITPEVDDVNGVTTYPFEITTNEEWTFFFEFVPNSTGSIDMELSFDDTIPARYDLVNTIKIVEEDELDDAEDSNESSGD